MKLIFVANDTPMRVSDPIRELRPGPAAVGCPMLHLSTSPCSKSLALLVLPVKSRSTRPYQVAIFVSIWPHFRDPLAI